MNSNAIRRLIDRLPISIIQALIIALVCFGYAGAQEGTRVSFGIRPTEAIVDQPETFSYFNYQLLPGVTISDAALVLNDGDVALDLLLYAADALTNQNGGTGFVLRGESSSGGSRGVGAWVNPSVAEVHLEPGEEKIIPFTITVPEDAAPGQHIAGLIVEAPAGSGNVGSGDDDTQFAVNIVQRVGVAVVVEVPGEKLFELEIGGVTLKPDTEAETIFLIAVQNIGNMFVRGNGILSLTDLAGASYLLIPFEMDTVLPGDPMTINVDHPDVLADGEYLLSVVLNYEGRSAIFEDVAFVIRDGELQRAGDGDEAPSTDDELDPGVVEEASDRRFMVFAVGLFGLAGLVAVFLFFFLRRMTRR